MLQSSSEKYFFVKEILSNIKVKSSGLKPETSVFPSLTSRCRVSDVFHRGTGGTPRTTWLCSSLEPLQVRHRPRPLSLTETPQRTGAEPHGEHLIDLRCFHDNLSLFCSTVYSFITRAVPDDRKKHSLFELS